MNAYNINDIVVLNRPLGHILPGNLYTIIEVDRYGSNIDYYCRPYTSKEEFLASCSNPSSYYHTTWISHISLDPYTETTSSYRELV